MFKLLVLTKNTESIKELCNNILSEISDIKLSGFGTSLEEFDALFEKVKPYIIMMDYTDYIHSKYSKKSVFNKLKIIFSDSLQTIKRTATQLFIPKNTNPNEIVKLITNFIAKENIILLRQKLITMLKDFHFDFKLVGTNYLLETILYCYENKSDYVFENLERNVYPYIAKQCNTQTNSVKKGILRATNIMQNHISISAQKQLFNILNLDTDTGKATPKQLINSIVTKLN